MTARQISGLVLITAVTACQFVAYTAGQATCTTSNALDESNGVGMCASYAAAGLSCDASAGLSNSFGVGGSYLGYCNHYCQFNFLDYPAIYGLDTAVALAWLGFPQNTQLVADIGTAYNESSQTVQQAAATMTMAHTVSAAVALHMLRNSKFESEHLDARELIAAG